jgi:CDP-paratose 2-epimerase
MLLTCLVTGSSGLIGSEACMHLSAVGFGVHGLDNNQRAGFFGEAGDTRWNQRQTVEEIVETWQGRLAESPPC